MLKKNTTIIIARDRLKMAKEAAAKGLDIFFWDMKAWEKTLATLKGEGSSSVKDPLVKDDVECKDAKDVEDVDVVRCGC